MKVIRIPQRDIMHGVKKANIYGYHDRKNLGIVIPTSQKTKKEREIQSRIDRNQVNINEWKGANADLRGNRTALEDHGSKPLVWSKNEFNNSMGGGRAENSGFSKGGDFNRFKAPKIMDSGNANLSSFTPASFKFNLSKEQKQMVKDGKTKAKTGIKNQSDNQKTNAKKMIKKSTTTKAKTMKPKPMKKAKKSFPFYKKGG
jgi:hypothetical protein